MFASGKKVAGGDVFTGRDDPAGYDWTHATLTQDGAWHELDLSGIIPAGTKIAYLIVHLVSPADNKRAWFMKNGQQNDYYAFRCRVHANSKEYDFWIAVEPDSNRKIEYKFDSQSWTDISVTVSGWLV